MRAIVTVGIPGCGKSTYARKYLAEGFVEVNRDLLRARLGGGFGVPRVEAAVTRMARDALGAAARAGRDLIVSDTHCTRRSRKDVTRLLRKLGYTRVEAHVFGTDVATCLARNAARPDVVPESVVLAMADRLARQPVWQSDGFDAIVQIDPPVS